MESILPNLDIDVGLLIAVTKKRCNEHFKEVIEALQGGHKYIQSAHGPDSVPIANSDRKQTYEGQPTHLNL